MVETIKIGITGAAGRMGRTLIGLCEADTRLQLAAAIERADSPLVGTDAGLLIGSESTGIEVVSDLGDVVSACDVVVDFTVPESTLLNVGVCRDAGCRMVVGTTGLGDDADKLKAASEKIAMVFAPNMSVGVNLCFRLAEIAARSTGEHFDVEIIEAHHRHKIDAPSGTAVRLGEIVADTLGRDLKRDAVYGREGITGPREQKTIGFETIRAGEIVGDHTVLFAGAGERIEITHRAQDRSTFASGALRAAQWIMQHDQGLFDMQDVLGLKD